MTEYGKLIISFIVLDFLQLFCWLFSLGPLTTWSRGRLDEQSGFFFICLIGIYVTIAFSIFLLIILVIKFYKSLSYIIIGLLLNIHVIIITIIYIKDVIIK
jgi:hypothetical protein